MSLDKEVYEIKKLKDICELNYSSYSKNENWDFFNYLDTKNIIKGKIIEIKFLNPNEDKIPSRAKRKVDNGDIIYSTVRPNQKHYGLIENKPPNFLVSTGFTTIKIDKKIAVPYFVYYYITQNDITEYLQTIAEQSTTSYPSIKTSDLGNIIIHLPPLNIQEKISVILKNINYKIKLNEKINSNLEEQILKIFNDWFVKFSLCDEFEESKLGLIPKGWSVDYLGSGKSSSIIGSGIVDFEGYKVYIATADVDNSSIINNKTLITLKNKPSRANMQPIEKSIWFAKMIDSRKLIMVDDYCKNILNNYIFSTGFCGLKCSEEYFYYLWSFLLTNGFDTMKNNFCTGTTMQAVNNKDIKMINFVLPDLKTVDKFNIIAKPIFKKIYLNNLEIRKLTKLRDTLLPKLMSGEIDVSKINCDLNIDIIYEKLKSIIIIIKNFILNFLKYLWRL